MQTLKITRSVITNTLIEAGFAKAIYRNAKTQRPTVEGFYIQLNEKDLSLYWHTTNGYWNDAFLVADKVAEMSIALTNAGITNEIISGFEANQIRIAR